MNSISSIRALMFIFGCVLFCESTNAQLFLNNPRIQQKFNLSTQSIDVGAGWNLLSLPVVPAEPLAASLFPTATSSPFVFREGYQVKDTLPVGEGFWIKYDSAQTVSVSGEVLFVDTIDVRKGWQMIGTLTLPVAVNTITSVPVGIIESQIFSFMLSLGYQVVDTLKPGNGYWVKGSQNGSLILEADSQQAQCSGIVSYAGKTYNTVQIGSQCWLKENLDVGTRVDGSQDQTNNSLIEKYCYNNDTAKCNTYGGLYQWNEAMQYSTTEGTKGICPSGWHIPTQAEFQTLITTVNNSGNALKAVGQGISTGAGTDSSGFSALLAGYRGSNSSFLNVKSYGSVWSSTVGSSTYPYYLYLYSLNSTIYMNYNYKEYGFSVRCIKDNAPGNTPPNQPSNPDPEDGATTITIPPTLHWSCSDPDGDALAYNVYLGADNPPFTVVSANQADTLFNIINLTANTTYYWKIVAKDTHGDSAAGPVWQFTTKPFACGDMVLYEGKAYLTVQIGAQCWFKENLNVGTMVAGADTQKNNAVIEKYCYLNNTAKCDTFGGLYQWDEAMQYDTTSGAQGICPGGWHLPTYDEIELLKTSVGHDGNAVKAVGQGTGDGAGTDTSGFSALLAGQRSIYATFQSIGSYAYIRTSTQTDSAHAYNMYLFDFNNQIHWYNSPKTDGLSVRCLKDQ
jgi:uncharacterized protein (TIGR02145 family)